MSHVSISRQMTTEWKNRAVKAEKEFAAMKSMVAKLGDVTKDLTTLLND